MAPLQKRALYGLVFSILWAVLIVILFIIKGGASVYSQDITMRLTLAGLLIGGAFAYLLITSPLIKLPGVSKVVIDERDKKIMDRAPRIQLVAVLIALAAWCIGLTEYYWDSGQIPVIFPYIVLLSMLIVNVIAASLGILVGYWRLGKGE